VETSKICKGCGVEKKLEDFHMKDSKTGLRHTHCKECRSRRIDREWDYGVRTCESCKETKSISEFPLSANGNPRKVCKVCRHRFEQYGLTFYTIAKIKEAQNGLCAICSVTLEELFAIDHDHNCCPGIKTCGRCVRGILCIQCNTRLQWFETYKKQAEEYLEKNNANTNT
jgi:hypothetical protein